VIVHRELLGGTWVLKFEVSRERRLFEVRVPANATPLELDAFVAKLKVTLRELATDGGGKGGRA
jgi:hypothetical protein